MSAASYDQTGLWRTEGRWGRLGAPPRRNGQSLGERDVLGLTTALDAVLHRLEALERRLGLDANSETVALELREDVTAEQAADEIIALLELDGPRRPSELETALRVDISIVLDALEVLEQRGWIADAPEAEDGD